MVFRVFICFSLNINKFDVINGHLHFTFYEFLVCTFAHFTIVYFLSFCGAL